MSHLNPRPTSTPHGINFDPSLYPRTYSVSSRHQTYWIVSGFALTVGFPLLLRQSHGMNASQKILAAVLPVLLGGYLILEAFKLKLVLESDAITVQHSFSTRRLLRCEIAGRRTQAGRGGTIWRILIPRGEGQKALGFPEILKTDPAFFAWFVGIPDLNSR
jgi:hypothetical protein